MKSQQTILQRRSLSSYNHGADRHHAKNFGWIVLWSLLLLLALPSASFGQQGTLTDDAYTLLKESNKTTGDEIRLKVKGVNVGGGSNAYIKFKLTSSLPQSTTGSNISKATLKLFVGNIHAAGSFDIYRVLGAANAWNESTLTTNLAGQNLTLIPEMANVAVDGNQQFVTVDVTQLVKDWLDGNLPNNGIALVGNGSSLNVEFDSKENTDTSHLPALEIVLGSVRSLSADGPLAVTNPTTTPNISLGTVPVANGGTGLSSAGSTGNLLRSDGSAWTSVPLSAADVPAGSGNYIHNSTSIQPDSNFNINGTGTANTLDATMQYNLGGNRILSNAGTQNLFAGVGAGAVNTGFGNSFFGSNAGANNSSGISNSFFGVNAGSANTTGSGNAFFGASGGNNTTASFNSFYGHNSGAQNTTGEMNSFFGGQAGTGNFTGNNNAFFGFDAGFKNATGNNLTLIGANTDVFADSLNFATAIGAGATVGSSNTVVLGRSADTVQIPGTLNVSGTFEANILNAATQFNLNGNRVLTVNGRLDPISNTFVGVNAGNPNTSGDSNSFFGSRAGNLNTTGGSNSFFGYLAGQGNTNGSGNSFFGSSAGQANSGGNSNSFFGNFAGNANTTGTTNSFFGSGAGLRNTTGSNNAFFGSSAGLQNTTGSNNDFFGQDAGASNTTGQFNSFFGDRAGVPNTTGSNNSFFGNDAGLANTTGSQNSFFGNNAGGSNLTGFDNVFFGENAGAFNRTGNSNTIIGANANVGANNLDHATAIGAGAVVNTSNTVVLGRSNDNVQVPGPLNAMAGLSAAGILSADILSATTQFNLGGSRVLSTAGTQNLFVGAGAGLLNTTGFDNTFIGFGAGNPDASTQVNNSVAIGAAARVSTSNTIVLGTSAQTTQIPGQLAVTGAGVDTFNGNNLAGLIVDSLLIRRLGSGDIPASPAPVCFRLGIGTGNGDGGAGLTNCTTSSSSIRYKTNLQPFLGGLDLINRLRPAAFKWKASGERDIGLIAEQVAEVEPLLTYKNDKGEIEGIKYANMSVLFINAFREQQTQINDQRKQIEAQQAQIKQQGQQIAALKQLLLHRRANRLNRRTF